MRLQYKHALGIFILCLCAFSTFAQVPVTLSPVASQQFFDSSGRPLAGGKLYSFLSGTNTLSPTFRDSTGTGLNTDPIILDSAGRAQIWLAAIAYKMVLQDAQGNQIWSVDNVSDLAFIAQQNLNVMLLTTNQTAAGNKTFVGNTVTSNINNMLVVDGVTYPTLASAVAQCGLSNTGQTIWVPDGTNPTLNAVLTVSSPCHIIFGKNTITCTMLDPGTGSGCINVTSDNVEIEGQGPLTKITQGVGANIQTAIFLGTFGNFRFHGMKIDWNDSAQTNAAFYYTGIRSAAGSHDIRIYDSEFTRGGDRAIDLRGVNRSWIKHNWFHQTGIGIAGVSTRGGNSVSVALDGTTMATDCWLEDNLVEEHGDAFACADTLRAHVRGNTIRGRADFGNAPLAIESGVDVSGDVDAEVIGNHVINVAGPQLYLYSLNIAGVNYVVRNIRVEGNTFVATATGIAALDPRVLLGGTNGGGIGAGQQTNIGFLNNSLDGVRAAAETVNNLQVTGNGFHNIKSTLAAGIALNIDQFNGGSGAVMKNFTVTDNTFTTDNATLLIAVNLTSLVTTPDSCNLSGNSTSTGVATDIFAVSGFSVATCYVQRSNRTIGSYSNAGAPVTVNFPNPLVYARWKSSSTTHVPGDWALAGNWGTAPPAVTINNNGNDDAYSITVTAGSGSPGASPTVTLTFHDGTRTNNPTCWANRADLSTPLPSAAPWVRTAITPTTVTFTFTGTPVAATAYALEGGCIGH